jgi:hypothetical protein
MRWVHKLRKTGSKQPRRADAVDGGDLRHTSRPTPLNNKTLGVVVRMRVYWTLKSVPELADLSAKDRRAIWREAYREGSRYTFGEIVLIALGAAVGAILGPLGAGLGVAIVIELIFSRIAERLRPRMMEIRQRRGLGLPVSGADT